MSEIWDTGLTGARSDPSVGENTPDAGGWNKERTFDTERNVKPFGAPVTLILATTEARDGRLKKLSDKNGWIGGGSRREREFSGGRY